MAKITLNISKILLTALIAFSFTDATAQAPNWEWAKKSVGDGVDHVDSVMSTATDSDGNVLVAGQFKAASLTFGSTTINNLGDKDAFIVKYNTNGNVVWVKNIGGVDEEQIYGIATDLLGNIYITGDYDSPTLNIDGITVTNTGNQDMFVAKLSSDGTAIWVKSNSGSLYDYGNAIAVDALGNVFIAGQFYSASINFGGVILNNVQNNQNHDVFLYKMDNTGNVLWGRSAGGTSYENVAALSINLNGDVYMTGNFYSPSITFGSTMLENYNNYGDIFLTKYNTDGTVLWARSIRGDNYDTVRALKTDTLGNVIVAGHYESTQLGIGNIFLNNSGTGNDIFLAQYDSFGTLNWVDRAGGSGSDLGTGMAIDSHNNIFLTGGFTTSSIAFGMLAPLSNAGFYDMYVTKFDNGGNAIWTKGAGGTGYDVGFYATMDNFDNLFISGATLSPAIDFNGITLSDNENRSLFTAKINVYALTVDQFHASKCAIYPNPASNILHIKSSEFGDNPFSIVDLSGRIILTSKLNSETTDVDVSNFEAGAYLIRFANNSTVKFIKE